MKPNSVPRLLSPYVRPVCLKNQEPNTRPHSSFSFSLSLSLYLANTSFLQAKLAQSNALLIQSPDTRQLTQRLQPCHSFLGSSLVIPTRRVALCLAISPFGSVPSRSTLTPLIHNALLALVMTRTKTKATTINSSWGNHCKCD